MSSNFVDYGNATALMGGVADRIDKDKFIGKRAEWNRLTQEEKAVYDGRVVNITDDFTPGGGGGGGGETYFAGPGINISDDNVISSKAVEFAGTQAEWDALSTQEKSVFDYINITDDTSEETYQPGHSISDGTSEKTQREVLEFDGFTVTDDSENGKTKISEVPYTAGSLIDITNKEISVDEDKVKATFVGTIAEWEALSSSEKAEYELVNLTDDLAGGAQAVVDAVEENNFSPVTSNAVARKLVKYLDASGSASSTGVISIPDDLSGKTILAASVTGANPMGYMAVGVGNHGVRVLSIDGSNNVKAVTSGTATIRWLYID